MDVKEWRRPERRRADSVRHAAYALIHPYGWEQQTRLDRQQPSVMNSSSLLLCFLLVAWVFLFALNFMLHDSRGLGAAGDSFGHLVPATRFLDGLGYTYRNRPELVFPPGYGLTNLPLYMAGFELIQAALITNVIALSLACLFTYLICRFYASRAFALVAIMFVVTDRDIMGLTTIAMSEATFMASISGAGCFVLAFIRQPKRNPLNLAVGGAFVGWAALTRPEGIGMALALLGFLWIDLFLRQPPPRLRLKPVARLALCGIIFAAPAIAIYAPYATFLSKHLGHFALSAKSEMNLTVGNAELHGEGWHLPLDPDFSALQPVPHSLRDDILRTAKNLIFYARHTIKDNLALFISLGLVLAVAIWRNGFRMLPIRFQRLADLWEPVGFCLFMLSPIIPVAYHMARGRLLVPYDLFVIICAVVLMDRIVAVRSRAARPTDARFYAVAVAAPLILLGAHLNLSRTLTTPPDYPLQTASVALGSLAPVRPVCVMTVRAAGMVTYYANDNRMPTEPHFELIALLDTPDTLAETMQAKGLQYLVLDINNVPKRPKVASLWSCAPDSCFGRFRLVAEEAGSYRIFELSPASAVSTGN